MSRVKIIIYVPRENADAVRDALGEHGAGVIGEYSYCSFTVLGEGRFRPSAQADPHIGEVNQLNRVEEERIEVVCDRSKAKIAIEAMKQAHPYEEVAFDIIPLLEESEL